MRPLFRWPVSLVPPNKLATSQSARLGIVLGLISLWYRSQLLAFAFRRRQLRCQHRVRTPGRKPDPEKRHHLHPLTVSHTSLLSSSPNSLKSCRIPFSYKRKNPVLDLANNRRSTRAKERPPSTMPTTPSSGTSPRSTRRTLPV